MSNKEEHHFSYPTLYILMNDKQNVQIQEHVNLSK